MSLSPSFPRELQTTQAGGGHMYPEETETQGMGKWGRYLCSVATLDPEFLQSETQYALTPPVLPISP